MFQDNKRRSLQSRISYCFLHEKGFIRGCDFEKMKMIRNLTLQRCLLHTFYFVLLLCSWHIDVIAEKNEFDNWKTIGNDIMNINAPKNGPTKILIIKGTGIHVLDELFKCGSHTDEGITDPLKKVYGNRLTVNQGGMIRNSKLTEDGWMVKLGILNTSFKNTCFRYQKYLINKNKDLNFQKVSGIIRSRLQTNIRQCWCWINVHT